MALIQGQVVDPHGRPVARAVVYMISVPGSMADISPLTDDAGRFSIATRQPGRYMLGVRSEEWGTAQAEVEVGDEGTAAVEVRFKGKEDKT